MNTIAVLVLPLLATLFAGFDAPAQELEPPPVVIRNVRVFDGTDLIDSATVVLERRRIAAIALPGETVSVPSGAVEVRGEGRTLLPGLIDSHTHSQSRSSLKGALAFGVMTHLDMFTALPTMRAMRAEQAAGTAADRADLFSAGTLVTAPNGHGTQYGVPIPTLANATEAQAFIDARIGEGSDYIKIVHEAGSQLGISVPTLDSATLRAAVVATHARSKLAVVHIGSGDGARMAIAAGADGIVHTFADRMPRPDFGRFVAEHHAFVVPTLAVLASASGESRGAATVGDPYLGPRLFPGDLKSLTEAPPLPPRAQNRKRLENALATVRALHEAGVPLLAGTDAPNPGTAFGASLHIELELLVRAGLTPREALIASTSAPARAFHLADRGRIAIGLPASLFLVEGDPTRDITATRRVVEVWKEGRRYRLDLYDAQLKALHAAADAEVGGPPPAGAESGVVSDFDEADAIGGLPRVRFGAGWETSSDSAAGGASSVSLQVVRGGAGGTPGALRVSGILRPGALVRYAGAEFRPGSTPALGANLSAFKGLRFRARGDGGEYRVYLYGVTGSAPIARLDFRAGPEWADVDLSFAESGIDGRGLRGILIAALGDPRTFAFLIDDVRLYR